MLVVEQRYYKRQRLVAAAGLIFAICLAGRLVVIQGFAKEAYAS